MEEERLSGSIISVRNASVRLNDHTVLEDISFQLERPSILMVVGPNGSGKTTLLKLLLGMLRPFKGTVEVLGLNPFQEGTKLRRLVGYVPQRDKVSYETPLKVGEVVLMGTLLKKAFPRSISKEDIEGARKALAYMGMENLWESFFNELSGGQQRRALIARALASDPALLFLDEVFAGLDLESQENLLSLLRIFKENGKTVIIVEHELDPIIDLADKILVLNRKLCAYGDPWDVLREEKLKPLYPCLRTLEKEGRRIVILGDKHA